mmetsp:Transcript_27766/g.58983  ORF Transcript_27766/g.58983 Transcript_27766/m.58983 type:complete len:219 (-) Transcript_27766:16-672(-)
MVVYQVEHVGLIQRQLKHLQPVLRPHGSLRNRIGQAPPERAGWIELDPRRGRDVQGRRGICTPTAVNASRRAKGVEGGVGSLSEHAGGERHVYRAAAEGPVARRLLMLLLIPSPSPVVVHQPHKIGVEQRALPDAVLPFQSSVGHRLEQRGAGAQVQPYHQLDTAVNVAPSGTDVMTPRGSGCLQEGQVRHAERNRKKQPLSVTAVDGGGKPHPLRPG